MAIVFPDNLTPDWIEIVELPARPAVSQKFQSGADSDLILSSISVGGKLAIEWYLNGRRLADLRAFWLTVDTTSSFTLSPYFFPTTCDPFLVKEFEACSSTGLWRFDAGLKIVTHQSFYHSVTTNFRGALL